MMWPFTSATGSTQRVGGKQPTKIADKPVELNETSPIDEYPPDTLTKHQDRLGMLFPLRLPIVSGAAFFGGLMLGGAKGGYTAADRYRAENAHRLPISRSGWYLYHKSKNYHTTVGSLKEGTKQGLVLMAWAALFATTEEVIDRARGRLFSRSDIDDESLHKQRDAASTVMAGFTVSGLYSWRQGFDQYATARMARVSLKYSLAYGLLQDILATLRGNQPGYVSWIMKKISPPSTANNFAGG